ncbi:hypothetical protein SAMN03097708_02320 [Thiohalomonas denitrificans]|uniref:Transmembrane protein n=2 Tax=Thiohalomonas denitrificans TaxID=415747 RepID=A0A1G5QN46_9GAMM|nr:hypothetical protein SAMN03097708_02320 [Thiohalomonas denitrificans]
MLEVMSDNPFKADPNAMHFAAGAFIGGVTGLALSFVGYPQETAAMIGLAATTAVGLAKGTRDSSRYPASRALKNGLLIASGGLITPIMLALQ